MYMKWMMAPINPNLYTSWVGQSMNPATYGSWGSFMTPTTLAAPVTGAAAPVSVPNPFDLSSIFGTFGQSATAPATAQAAAPAYAFNFFDPNAWGKMFAQPVAPAATPTAPAK